MKAPAPNYRFKEEYIGYNAKDLVQLMLKNLQDVPLVPSIEGNKPYYINKVSTEEISFTSPERNNGDPETIHRVHLTPVFRVFLQADFFNLKSHKDEFQSAINKKRAATMAFMKTAGLLMQVVETSEGVYEELVIEEIEESDEEIDDEFDLDLGIDEEE